MADKEPAEALRDDIHDLLTGETVLGDVEPWYVSYIIDKPDECAIVVSRPPHTFEVVVRQR